MLSTQAHRPWAYISNMARTVCEVSHSCYFFLPHGGEHPDGARFRHCHPAAISILVAAGADLSVFVSFTRAAYGLTLSVKQRKH